MHPHRRTNAPGPSPVEFRRGRGRVPVRLTTQRVGTGTTGHCHDRQARRAPVRRSTSRRAHGACFDAPDRQSRYQHLDNCKASSRDRSPRRFPTVDVAEWTRHRPTKPESAGSTLPSTRTSRRSSVDESTALRRRGSHVRTVPARRVVVVQRRGCEHATLAMRVRLPPATPNTATCTEPVRQQHRMPTQKGSGVTCPPTSTTS